MFKIFRTNSNDVVQSCQLYFEFRDMTVLLTARKKNSNEVKYFVQLLVRSVQLDCTDWFTTDLQKLI